MSTNRNAVAVVGPRLPWNPNLEKEFGDMGIRQATWKPLVEAIFPAAKTAESIAMALGYCRARKLDPFKRPVNIVPVWDSSKGTTVETVWPSITEHRITAHRTGQYAGMDPMIWGPMITKKFEGKAKRDNKWEDVAIEVTFPEWVRLTVYKLMSGQRVPFTAEVYWLETYGKQGGSKLPNAMWANRPRGQLSKCAEAQALRMAFPEELSEPTAEEMEGQIVNHAPVGGPIVDEAAIPSPSLPVAPPAAKANVADAEELPAEFAAESENPAPKSAPKKEAPKTGSVLDQFKVALDAANTPTAINGVWEMFDKKLKGADRDAALEAMAIRTEAIAP